MEEVVKRHILESLREKYHRAEKLAKRRAAQRGTGAVGMPPEASRDRNSSRTGIAKQKMPLKRHCIAL